MSACLARVFPAAAVLVCLLAPDASADDLSGRFVFAPIEARFARQPAALATQDGALVMGQRWPFDTEPAADRAAGGEPEAWGDPGSKAERLQAMLQLAALWRF